MVKKSYYWIKMVEFLTFFFTDCPSRACVSDIAELAIVSVITRSICGS